MGEDTLEQRTNQQESPKLKCYWRAAKYGGIAGVSGMFAFCMYDGYYRLHENLCDCTKYASIISVGSSHITVAIGVLAGISIVSTGYLLKHMYDGVRHHCLGGIESKLKQ